MVWSQIAIIWGRGRAMSRVLNGSATSTHAVRVAIQRSQASVVELAEQYSLNEKTVRKWRERSTVEDVRMGSKEIRSSVLSAEEEAMCAPSVGIRFCRWTVAAMRSKPHGHSASSLMHGAIGRYDLQISLIHASRSITTISFSG